MFKLFLFKLGQMLAVILPRRAVYRLALFLSDCQCRFSKKDRLAVSRNMETLTGSGDHVAEWTGDVFRNFGRYLVEFFLLPRMDRSFVEAHTTFENLEALKSTQQAGRGGIIVTAHLGNWELGAVMLSLLGFKVNAVALPHKEQAVNKFFNQRRMTKGIRVIPSHFAFRRCLEALSRGEYVALVGDRDFYGTGVRMPFLGRDVILPKGAAVLACKKQCPVIPVFLIRTGFEQFHMKVMQPIYPTAGSDIRQEDQIYDMIKKIAAQIEDMIRKYPAQWLMFREIGEA